MVTIRSVGLTKHYGAIVGVEDLELSVGAGEIYGFVGLNGAGKSTTIRLLLGMIRPTRGHAEVLGARVGPGGETLWRRVGFLVESATAYPDLTVRENLEVARTLQGVGEAAATGAVIERLGLGPYADRRAGTLSTGNLQRLALARALLHEPELLILDEPSTGLDPAGVAEVRDLLLSLARDRGTTVFMSSHILTEVDRIAARVGVLHGGRLIAELSAAELDRRRGRRLEVGARDLAAAAAALRAGGFDPVRGTGTAGAPVLTLNDDRALAEPDRVAAILAAADAPPSRLAVVRDDMETFFLSLTRSS